MDNWGSLAGKPANPGRRAFIAGAAVVSLLALPGCQSIGRVSYTEAVRRLLTLASQRAFAKLTQPDGFWDSTVARVDLPVLFGKTGSIMKGVLKSAAFREQLQHQLNRFAEDGARRAAPLVAEASRSISITDAAALIGGSPTSATTFLRAAMGPALVNAMIPELTNAMQVADNPLLGQALGVLAGVNIGDAAHGLALEADNAIWYQVGEEEAQIRRDPRATNDPLLITALAAMAG